MYDAARVGLTDQRTGAGKRRTGQRISLAVAATLLFGALLGQTACRRPTLFSPDQTYSDAWLQLKRGDLNSALTLADAGLSQFPSSDGQWHWRFIILKAETLVRQRRNAEALVLLRGDLPPTLASSDLGVWSELSRGTAYAFLGQFPAAKEHLAAAETLTRSSHHDLLGEVYLRYGTLAFLQADFPGAEGFYRKALEASREQQDDFLQAAALGSLGLVATKEEHYDESIDWDQGALQLSRSVGAQNSEAIILGNMGWSYTDLGNYENALALLRQAEEASTKAGLIGARAPWLIDIARIEYVLRDYANSERDSQAALGYARELSEKQVMAECLNNLSYLAMARGDLDQAESYNREAQEITRAGNDRSGETASELLMGRILLARKKYEPAKKDLLAISRDLAADSATHWEAEASLAKLYEQEGEPARAESEYRRASDTFQITRHSIREDELRLAFLANAVDFYDDYIGFLIEHGRVEDALRVADHTRAQTMMEGLLAAGQEPAQRVVAQEIARKFDSTLLIYWLGENQSHLWVVTPAQINHFRLPKKSEIESQVEAYREQVSSGKDVLGSDRGLGGQLYATLVAPAVKFLPPNRRIIVLPGEGLYGLSFESLIVPVPKPHYWIEDVTISEAGSLALLSSQGRRAPEAKKSLLLMGDAQQANPDFPALPQAPSEMRRVAAHFAPAQCVVLEGAHATASAYLQSNPERFSYLHFVTHGIASETQPLESAVVLSREGDSYKLYARDIVARPLKAQLVTISACNGAGTRAYAGEGLVGLSWAFLRAGAHNVVASLWEVSDAASTAALMDTFYGGLDRGEDPAAALRKAKLQLLHSSQGTVFAKPFYWAPFQLYVGS